MFPDSKSGMRANRDGGDGVIHEVGDLATIFAYVALIVTPAILVT